MSHEATGTIAIVGAGEVGSSFAYAALIRGVARKLILVNRTLDKARGDAMDLSHAMPFCSPTEITEGDYSACAEADVVVITAGASQEPGMSRLELTRKNAEIIKSVVGSVMEHNPDPILLVVSNPVDILTYVALKESGLPPSRVFGSGTVLDSARFRYLLSRQCGVDPRNVHCNVVGEHGDSEILLWSRANIGGVSLDEYCANCERECPISFREAVTDDVRKAAYRIIEAKGATSYGIGMSVVRILEAVLDNQSSVLTVSTLIKEYEGVRDTCFSLPSIVSRKGVVGTLFPQLEAEERRGLVESASLLRKNLESIGY